MDLNQINIVIMAGGKGTRISSVASDIPKPMIWVAGKPILEHQLAALKRQGAKQVTIIVGHMGNVICDYFGDGKKLGIEIQYIVEKEPLGTAGGLRFLNDDRKPVLLINGDILFDIDFDRMIEFHLDRQADITLFTHPNHHPYDSALIETTEDGRIVNWLNKEDDRKDYQNRVNAGIHILNPIVLDSGQAYWSNSKVDLDRDILKTNINNFRIYAYDSPEYVKDMGTPDRYYEVEQDYCNGIVGNKNLKKRQKAIFLDRDGTINEYVGFVTKPEQIRLIDGVADAICKINRSGYLAIVVTNQPIIARGDCTLTQLRKIHNRLERLLGENGVYLDGIVYCPHHPDKGFQGEITELKFNCECRKPKPGMLFMMAEKYNIDLKQSYMVGDDERDIEAGNAAGCKTIYLGNDTEIVKKADWAANNLLGAVDYILNED